MKTKKAAAPKAAAKTTAPAPAPEPKEIDVIRPAVDIAPGISLLPSLMISANLVPFKTKADELTAMASRAVINSTDSYERGIAFLTLTRDNSRQLEDYRVSVKRPIDDYAKLIQAMFKPLIDQIDAAGRVVSQKMLAHKQEQDRKAQEEAAERRRAQEAEAARLAKEFADKGKTAEAQAVTEAVAAAPPVVATSPLAHVRVGGAAAQTRKTWVGTVEKPMVVLQAIIDGKLPISLIEFKPAELNAFARDLKIKGTHLGILVDETESLGVR